MNLKLFCWCFVVDRGIEPLCQDWQPCILTIRWIHHLSLTIEDCCGRWGIRTPGTINSYGSLANCWFQPLTQTSFRFVLLPQAFRLMRCKGSVLFLTAKTFAEKFLLPPSFFLYFAIPDIEQLIHIIYITISRRVDNKICFPLTTAVCKSCKRKSEKHSPAGWRDHTVGIEEGWVLLFHINCIVCHNTFS